jgi:hypothetical protein
VNVCVTCGDAIDDFMTPNYSSTYTATGTVEECEAEMRRLSDGKHGCQNPEEHSLR